MTLWTWSQTAATNATADSTIDWEEGQLPSTVNNSARAMMAAAAKYRDDIAGFNRTAGTATAYTLSSNQVFDSLAHLNNAMVAFVPHATNTGACTLSVDGLGAMPIHLSPGIDMPSGTMIQGTPYLVTYFNGAGEFLLHGGFNNPYATPVGGMIEYIAATPPNSAFILPYGQQLSRTVYSNLFGLIGTTFGSGNGSTTFNAPDIRGCTIACPDNMGGASAGRLTSFGGSGTVIGSIGGSQTQTLAQANLPNVTFYNSTVGVSASGSYSGTTTGESNGHTHTFTTGTMNSNQSHSHSYNQASSSGAQKPAGTGTAPYDSQTGTTTGATNIDHTHSGTSDGNNVDHTHNFSGSVSVSGATGAITVTSGGSGAAFALVQPTMILPRILRII